jgi:hypothetical protein
MATLSKSQQTARRLADELSKMDGAWVESPMPLDDHAKLRFQILDSERNRILQTLRDWGWEPAFVGIKPRVHFSGFIGACLWEIDLPRKRQPIVDHHGQTITRKIATKEKTSAEIEGMRRYLGSARAHRRGCARGNGCDH